jgi:hypothetical protein
MWCCSVVYEEMLNIHMRFVVFLSFFLLRGALVPSNVPPPFVLAQRATVMCILSANHSDYLLRTLYYWLLIYRASLFFTLSSFPILCVKVMKPFFHCWDRSQRQTSLSWTFHVIPSKFGDSSLGTTRSVLRLGRAAINSGGRALQFTQTVLLSQPSRVNAHARHCKPGAVLSTRVASRLSRLGLRLATLGG